MENKIIKEIKKLKKDISPRPEWVALSRDILLQQIDPQEKHQAVDVSFFNYAQLITRVFRQRLLEPAVIMLLVLGIFLGSSLTINAAFYSLPGDNLYPIKIALEKTHVALVPGEENKVELKMEFAQKRIAELDKIVAQSDINPEVKKKKIEAVVKEFKNNVVAVNDHLNNIKDLDDQATAEDKAQTVRMALTVSSQTEELVKSIDEKVEGLSEVERMEVEEIVAEAVQSAEETSLSAQELAEAASQPAEDLSAEASAEAEGIIEGAEIQEPEEAGLEDEVSEEIIKEETVEASTAEVSEEEEVIQDDDSDILETTENIIE